MRKWGLASGTDGRIGYVFERPICTISPPLLTIKESVSHAD